MRVDNRVTQVPPPKLMTTGTTKTLVAVQRMVDATVPEDNSLRIRTVPRHQLEDLLRVETVPTAPVETAALLVTATLVVEAAVARAPHTGLAGEPATGAIAEAEAT
jgi:hypothetical protein